MRFEFNFFNVENLGFERLNACSVRKSFKYGLLDNILNTKVIFVHLDNLQHENRLNSSAGGGEIF